MSRLDASKRARLPVSAFAYVDSRGKRRLPIHDEAHVRNALARFNQVGFEDDAARERARKRLLNAAKKYGIMPVGFITGQLQSERRDATAGRLVIELGRHGAPGELEQRLRSVLRAAVLRASGREIDARADEYFAVFERAAAAIEAAAAIQRALGNRAWPDDLEVRVRVGIHSGRPTLTDVGYIGLAVHTTARVCSAAHGGQIVISGATRAAVAASASTGIRFLSLGRHRLPGLPDVEMLFQVQPQVLRVTFPRPRTGRHSVPRRQPDDRRARLENRRRPEEGQLELPQPPG